MPHGSDTPPKDHRTNLRLRELRLRHNWSQQEFAEQIRAQAAVMGLNLAPDEKRIGRWERGEVRWPSPAYRRVLTGLLQVSVEQLGFQLPDHRAPAPRDEPAPETSGPATQPPASAGPWPTGHHGQTMLRADLAAVERVEALSHRLRQIDAERGGRDLCAPVASHIQHGFELLRTEHERGLSGRLHTAAAELAQLGGWLCYDAGRHQESWRYYDMALYAAHLADDRRLASRILGCMSLQATYVDQAREGVALARTALEGGRGTLSAREQAMLLVRQARGHARLGAEAACRRALAQAAERFDQVTSDGAADTAEEPTGWVAFFDAAELAANTGICLLDLGKPAEAQLRLAEAVLLADDAQARNRCLYLGRLATAQLMTGQLDRACDSARTALATSVRLGSARSLHRLHDFRRLTERYGSAPAVRAFDQELRAAGV